MSFYRHALWSSAAFVAIMSASAEVRAQAGEAVLTGKVIDASTKAPVPDVVVTVTSPAVQGEQTVVTDGEGYFRVQALPPGTYQIRLDKESYKPYARANIELRADVTIRVDAEVLPEGLKEEIVVVASPPTVDVGSSNTGLTITNGFAKRVPLVNPGSATSGAVRSYEAVAQATPQASNDTFGTSINGTTSPENNYQVDGLSRNNAGFGVNGARLSIEFVKEVNVLTGGYMPEYGAAGGGILSAVTKSGSNEFHGSGWFYITPGALEGDRKLVSAFGQTIKTTRRLGNIFDLGADVGGPIIQDKLWFYTGFIYARTSYNLEKVIQNSSSGPLNYTLKNYPAGREDIQVLGKLTYGVDKHNKITVTGYALPTQSGGSNRVQIDPLLGVPGVGNVAGSPDALFNEVRTNTFSLQADWDTETASKKVLLKTTVGWMHQTENTYANDGSGIGDRNGLATIPGVAWRRNSPGPHSITDFEPVGPGECDAAGTPNAKLCPARTYSSGGPGFLSLRTFDRYQARSVLTVLGELGGHHVIKGGVTFDYLKYHVIKTLNGNPVFNYRTSTFLTTPGDMPYRATIGSGDPDLSTNNREFGAYLQDDWRINSRLTANIGLRWDFETDMLNNSYVTPANVRTGFAGVYPSNYFTDGSNRPTYYGAVQPRVGLSYDVTGDGRTIVYAGYGKYTDRTLFNDILDEKFRLQYRVSTIWFSKDGTPQDGRPAVMWDPKYLSLAGLQSLIASGRTDPPEVYLLDNNTRPPSSDQWSLGARHNFGMFTASLNYSGVQSRDQLTWTCGVKNAAGGCDFGARPAAGLGFSLINRGKDGWFNSLQFAVDKPFSSTSMWGAYLSYVYADAKQTGNDLFSFNLLDPIYGTKQRSSIAQKHTILLTGTVGLPLEFRLSTVVSLGSGYPFFSTDCSLGFDKCVDLVGGGDPPKWTESIDFRLEKGFTFGGSYTVSLIAEVINAFNYTNEQYYEGFKPALPEINANYGHAYGAYNPRRLQFGARFSF